MVTLLHEQAEITSKAARVSDGDVWISPQDLELATGWSLKPQGFCLDDVCVPVPAGDRSHYVEGDEINAAAFWRRLGNPIVHDAAGEIWVFGTGASHRASSLQSLEAPDFELPDLSGAAQSFSQHRGKKILLVTWASW